MNDCFGKILKLYWPRCNKVPFGIRDGQANPCLSHLFTDSGSFSLWGHWTLDETWRNGNRLEIFFFIFLLLIKLIMLTHPTLRVIQKEHLWIQYHWNNQRTIPIPHDVECEFAILPNWRPWSVFVWSVCCVVCHHVCIIKSYLCQIFWCHAFWFVFMLEWDKMLQTSHFISNIFHFSWQ